jgi:hypothetical protein
MFPTLTPAYGRDYKSKKEILADWEAGKDFVYAETGQYINKQDAETQGIKGVNIRYKRLANIAVLTFKGGAWK